MLKDYNFHNNIYKVDDKGLVYGKNGKKLKQTLNKDGYLEVELTGKGLNKNGNRIRYKVKVHTMVAKSFIPLPDNVNRYEVNHKDFDRTNNFVSNLEWLTHYDNVKYSIINGRHKDLPCIGEKNIHSKLTNSDIKKIRKLYFNGMSIRNIYEKFYKGVISETSIGNICRYKAWNHL